MTDLSRVGQHLGSGVLAAPHVPFPWGSRLMAPSPTLCQALSALWGEGEGGLGGPTHARESAASFSRRGHDAGRSTLGAASFAGSTVFPRELSVDGQGRPDLHT